MASILPENSTLTTIVEGSSSSFTFTSNLDATETLVSLEIISTDFPSSIIVSGPTFSGTFSNLFKLDPGSLKYRKGIEYGTADSFASLPSKGTADLYSFTAPQVMLKNFNVKVKLTYTDATMASINITKDYVQPVQGNWDTFKQQFLNYVR